MNIANLSFSTLPPISVPFRYFISAAVFLMLCAGFILFSGEATWLSRWHPNMLVITHLFTLGFISMVMMGAIFQFLPVIGGVGVPNARAVASIAHSLHTLGTLALSVSFIFPNSVVRIIAILALGVGFTFYIFAIANVLIKKLSQGYTIIGMRLALFSLILVVGLGLLFLAQNMLLPYVDIRFLSNKNYTDIHALIGGFGWAGLLILAVSLQIIPMFHVTPAFPKWVGRYLPSSLVALLLSLFIFNPDSVVGKIMTISILALYIAFALIVLNLFKQRKRKVVDTSVQFWQLAAASFLAVVCLYFLPDAFFVDFFNGNKSLLLGAIFLFFYLVSIIEAMLLKIIPFLTYTHLQNLCLSDFSAMAHLPHMHELLLKKHGRWLFYLHLLSGCTLIITLALTQFYGLFAFALFAEFSLLLYLMLRSLRMYKQCLNKISQNV